MAENETFVTTGERADLLGLLADQRHNLLITVRGIDDEQARARTTVSELTLGGLIKHVTRTERNWLESIREPDENAEFDMADAAASHAMTGDETIAGLIDDYRKVAAETERTIAALDDLDTLIPLPTAPWAPERQWWTARRVLLHVLRETAQHSGHADIIRESLDGANTTRQMGEDAGMEF
ncbi:DinB family protein [Prescottella sp. R16]|uniref:DinB family protein n=1 Tax=Prescottella sp. R16 TaxID=3064529 RepID=UPI00272DF711|nr:DinB family protein [Prescottella sp. R16]